MCLCSTVSSSTLFDIFDEKLIFLYAAVAVKILNDIECSSICYPFHWYLFFHFRNELVPC